MQVIDIRALEKMMAEKYVDVQKHPEFPLYIYNYTQSAQYERVWNEITLACRGLILDAEYNVVARPFPKFFNLGEIEHQVIPSESFEVFEKMDGSLGILYWLNGEAFIATRGSFVSDQALKATAMLREKYAHVVARLDPAHTYLFEIIYPENRIVVDYGGLEDLILLAVIDRASGLDLALPEIGFPLVKCHQGIQDIHILKALEAENREGFVIKYRNGLRYKVKFEEYLRIHRLVTGVSSISIWEYMAAGMPFDEMLDRVPDEFYEWVKRTRNTLKDQFQAIEDQCTLEFKVLETRKETAGYYHSCSYPAVLFKMLDGKPYDALIWKMIRPDFQKAMF